MSRTELYGVGDRVPNTSSCGDEYAVANVSSFDISSDMNKEDNNLSDVVRVNNLPANDAPQAKNDKLLLEPEEYTNVDQANMYAREYQGRVRYSTATNFIYFNGKYWKEDSLQAQHLAQLLTKRQLEEADGMLEKITTRMQNCGVTSMLNCIGAKGALSHFTPEQADIFYRHQRLVKYKSHILAHRSSKNIEAVLSEVKPMVKIEVDSLDAASYLLNTQSYTYDLRLGLNGRREHRQEDFCTKICQYDPSNNGRDIWLRALDTFFCKDQKLIDYAQDLMGAALFGKTSIEALIIAYGSGKNGKSSFFGAISQVLGNYSHTLSSDILLTGCRRNIKYEMAELRGKRFVLAGELEEKTQLNTSVLKQLTSVDSIAVERKYVTPYVIRPSHTLILHTNHRPEIKALDNGTWRRIILLPFYAQIANDNDIKNYGDFLAEKAGEAILSWLIEGAERMYKRGFKLDTPQLVQEVTDSYKSENNWISPFLDEYCETDNKSEGFTVQTKDIYTAYCQFCLSSGVVPHNKKDVYSAIEAQGFRRFKKNNTLFFMGLRLQSTVETLF